MTPIYNIHNDAYAALSISIYAIYAALQHISNKCNFMENTKYINIT